MDVDTVVSLIDKPKIAEFRSGDTVKVTIKIKEGDRERSQAFQGTVIRSRGKGTGATFTVRRVSYGIGVERTFPFQSPLVESVEVMRRVKVRKARLYYLRGRYGRAARIKEDRTRTA